MSNAKTGIWAAIGALAGGAAGAFIGKHVAETRPRAYGGRAKAEAVEDAIVVGGAAGAVFGAFVTGAAVGEETPPQLAQK